MAVYIYILYIITHQHIYQHIFQHIYHHIMALASGVGEASEDPRR